MKIDETNIYVWNVSEISQAVKSTVESSFEFIKVKGEISKPSYPSSGHIYFSLKDETSVLNAVIWKYQYLKLSLKLEEGLEVICSGKLSTFPGGSRYQIIIQDIQHAGEGALLKQLEERKNFFLLEGLFDNAYKKSIPKIPRSIAVVTSPSGAVIKDILHRINERWPCNVIIYPVKVQGKNASSEIANAIISLSKFNTHNNKNIPDTIIVARGGGSIEDLWSFNEEEVVRAVFESKIPVISAIGHETDTTLIDYVSDLRAPTPSAAAELATPVKADLELKIKDTDYQIHKSIFLKFSYLQEKLKYNEKLIFKFETFLNIPAQKIDSVSKSFAKIVHQILSDKKINLSDIVNKTPFPEELVFRSSAMLQKQYDSFISNFSRKINDCFVKFQKLNSVINSSQSFLSFNLFDAQIQKASESQSNLIQNYINLQVNILLSLKRLLNSNSINGILQKGFVMTMDTNGNPIKSAKTIIEGEIIKLKYTDGKVDTKVKKIDLEESK